MTKDKAEQVYEVNLCLRGGFRKMCLRLGCDYVEAKGWFDSTFRVRGSVESLTKINELVKTLNTEDSDA